MSSGLWVLFPLPLHIFPEWSQSISSLLLPFESLTFNSVTFAQIRFLNSRQAMIFPHLHAQTSKLTIHAASSHQLPERETLEPCCSRRGQRPSSTGITCAEPGPGSEPAFWHLCEHWLGVILMTSSLKTSSCSALNFPSIQLITKF